jgi:flavin reductase (DIM6/NTAB) family NADH-FMN oxidoreductase RutF
MHTCGFTTINDIFCFEIMIKHYSPDGIQEMERFYRANFINCLTGFKSPVLIGTVDTKGNHNLAIFNNLVHLGADPALIGFVNRPRAAAPHTLANIEATGVYTINHIQMNFVEKAHQTSAKYPEGVSEFEKTGLTTEKLGDCLAPFVKESPIKFSMELKEVIPIHFNNTFFVIGAIRDIYLDSSMIEADGCLNLQETGIITSLGINGYYDIGKGIKIPYAKP